MSENSQDKLNANVCVRWPGREQNASLELILDSNVRVGEKGVRGRMVKRMWIECKPAFKTQP